MPIPAGYTQLTTGFWRKDSDLSGPYAWTGAAFYLISTGVAGSGVPADYTQHPSGFWFKTADASGPYSYDGTNFWLAGNGGPSGAITVATVNVSSAINMANGSTFNLYNTADQTTNYERLRADYSSNVARIYTQFGGSATTRAISFGVGTSAGLAPYENLIFLQRGAVPFVSFVGNVTTAITGTAFVNAGGILTAALNTQFAFGVTPTINQSGTAGYTALDINPTETATGSGTKLLQRWAVGGTARAQLNSAGGFWAEEIDAITVFGFAGGIGATPDVTLYRDAAYTLALRRSTNAQTFRVYNTYTDGSNYERGVIYWNSNVFTIDTGSAGTGTARAMTIGTSGATDLTIKTNGSGRWKFNSSGHFIAGTDNTYDIGASGANRPRNLYLGGSVIANAALRGNTLEVVDGITAPVASSGVAKIYVDSADGDLKIIFGDGTIKTIVTDT